MEKTIFEIGDSVKCINTGLLKSNDIAPKLELEKEYKVKQITYDREKNQHLDVGLPSKVNFVRSIETWEELKDGDKIHWCHPSRFEKI